MLVLLLCPACGRKGPPLPPLVKLPTAPGDLVAERHGGTVDIRLVVPVANTDGTRPANLARVDVYGITGPTTLTDQEVLKAGTKVASLRVKAPRDPDKTIDPDEAASEMEPPGGEGLDQGAVAHVAEELTAEILRPTDTTKARPRRKPPKTVAAAKPLLPLSPSELARWYVGVGVTTKGRNGPLSQRVVVPMVPPPPPPSVPKVEYDEKAVTVSWTPIRSGNATEPPADSEVLPSTPIGVPVPAITYNVYEVSTSERSDTRLTRLTKDPIDQTQFADARIVWNEERCYTVRAVETIDGVRVESDEAPATCRKLIDTFAPAAPKGLQAISSEGAISLIWDANTEKDIRGYLVMRGDPAAAELTQVTPQPIQETSFKDAVRPGVRYAYAVRAIDTAGNIGAMSERVEETAR